MVELNDLLGYKNRKIYQNKEYFNFTLDSILIANFCKIKLTTKKILDIGTGTGAIPLILSLRTKAKIDAVEYQKKQCELFQKSIEYNKLNSQINLYNEDIKVSKILNRNNYYDLIVCNPPYFKDSIKNNSEEKTIARHDVNLTILDLAIISKKILKNEGTITIIYDSFRLIEILKIFENHNLIPKRIRMIHPDINSEANRVLIEFVKNGKIGLKIENPFILYEIDHEKTNEYKKLIECED